MALLLDKWLFTGILALVHPYFISVTEINHNPKEKTIEISCKTFTDDLEKSIEKTANLKIDVVKEGNSPRLQKLILDYITKHLVIKADGKALQLEFVGFENEDMSTWSYFQVKNISKIKKLEITNRILHEASNEQINLMHVTVNNNRKSTKIDFPDTNAVFDF